MALCADAIPVVENSPSRSARAESTVTNPIFRRIVNKSIGHHAELWFMRTFADSGTESLFRTVWEANTLLVLLKR